jgi:hypothetical protein
VKSISSTATSFIENISASSNRAIEPIRGQGSGEIDFIDGHTCFLTCMRNESELLNMNTKMDPNMNPSHLKMNTKHVQKMLFGFISPRENRMPLETIGAPGSDW